MKLGRKSPILDWRNWLIGVVAIAISLIVAAQISPAAKSFLGDATVVAWLAICAAIGVGVWQLFFTRAMQRNDLEDSGLQAMASASARINNVLNAIPQARWALKIPEDVPDFDFLRKIIEWKESLEKIDRTAIRGVNPAFANALTLCVDALELAEGRLRSGIGDPAPTITKVLDYLTNTLLPFRSTTADAIKALASNASPQREGGDTSSGGR